MHVRLTGGVIAGGLSVPCLLAVLPGLDAACSSASSSGEAFPIEDAAIDAFDASLGSEGGASTDASLDASILPATDASEAGPNCAADGGPSTFTCTASMSVAREVPGGATLPNGKVLVAGGWNPKDGVLKSAELYDPAAGTFAPTGSMAVGHLWAGWGAAWPLVGGKVLVAGGLDASGNLTASAELFDPAGGVFAATGPLLLGVISMAPLVLDDQSVIFIGGWSNVSSLTSTQLPSWSYTADSGTSTVQRYGLDGGAFARTGAIGEPRLFGCNVRVPGGPTLAIGGALGPATIESNIEQYDLEAGTWASVGVLANGTFCARAFPLPNGKILLTGTGGLTATTAAIPGMLLLDPGSANATGPTQNALANFSPSLVQLASGDVLAFGGTLNGAPTAIAQVYSWMTNAWSTVGHMTQARSGAVGAYLLVSGEVLIAGGADESGMPLATAEIYHP